MFFAQEQDHHQRYDDESEQNKERNGDNAEPLNPSVSR